MDASLFLPAHAMPVTLTIKQVPDRIAERLRLRAAATHRSLQGELLAILESAVFEGAAQVRQPEAQYRPAPAADRASDATPARGERMTLEELWARSRRLGPPSQSESAAIVRAQRDERHGR